MSKTHASYVLSFSLLVVGLVLSATFAFAQELDIDASLEAELNAIGEQVDKSTAVEINVQALGTEADVSAEVGVPIDGALEYDSVFGAPDPIVDTEAELSVEAESDEGISIAGFFVAVFDFLFGWITD